MAAFHPHSNRTNLVPQTQLNQHTLPSTQTLFGESLSQQQQHYRHPPISTASTQQLITHERIHRTLLLLGAPAVGKSSLCVRFTSDRFDDAYEPTYEHTYTKLCTYQGKEIQCCIKDTQGMTAQDRFRSEYGLGIHGYILVYSVHSLSSFLTIKALDDKLCDCIGTRLIPRVLVAHKSDHLNSSTPNSGASHHANGTSHHGNRTQHAHSNGAIHLHSGAHAANSFVTGFVSSASVNHLYATRQVTSSEGASLARELGIPFVECSSKSNVHVDAVFMALFDEIDRYNEPGSRVHVLTSFWNSCFTSLCCCACSCLLPDNVVDPLHESNSWERLMAMLIVSTIVVGVCGMAGSIAIAILAVDNDNELMASILFGFAFVLTLLAFIGATGLRQSLVFLMRIFSVALILLIVVQLLVFVALLLKWPFFLEVLLPSSCVCALACLVEGVTASVSAAYTQLLRSSITNALLEPVERRKRRGYQSCYL